MNDLTAREFAPRPTYILPKGEDREMKTSFDGETGGGNDAAALTALLLTIKAVQE